MGEGALVGVLPTGAVTFLFTDIEGSTPLWDAHPVAMREALARHDEIVREAIDAEDGYVFSTGGDGFAAVFTRAGDAIGAAVRAQRELRAEVWPDDVELRVRMGLHTGEVQERDGDYFGPPVNRAARIMGAANGYQIVVSDLTARLMDPSAGVGLVDLGAVQLKGVVEPVHVFGVDADDAGWVDRPLVSALTVSGNLPQLQTELFADLVDLQERVSTLTDARLVTLTGSGGVGKTRTAVEIGWLVVDEFVDGVWLVELAPIADPDVVVAALASALSIQPQPGMSIVESIVDWGLGRRMLLIIDNCEHVLDPVTEIVTAVVAGCPTVTVIATSREPLGVDGEHVIRIPSLSPTYGVELFCDRAAKADSTFVVSDGDVDTITAICARVDGIPLAIELAAARIRSLSPQELLDRLDDRFRLLRGSGRGGMERHQTLRAAVKWSYQLLSDDDQLLFDRLSVFAGGFDLAATEAVCGGGGVDEYDVVDLIGELVDKSMLTAERQGSSTRYRLLETLRQYGEERLEDRGETSTIRDRHLEYYHHIAGDIAERWFSPDQLEVDEIADREWDNLRAAHGWAISCNDFDRANEINKGSHFYAISVLRHEHGDWVTSSLALGERIERNDGYLYGQAALWAYQNEEPVRAVELAEKGLAISKDEQSISINRSMRAYGLAGSGRLEEALDMVAELRDDISQTEQPAIRLLWSQLIADLQPVPSDIEIMVATAKELGGPTPLAKTQRSVGNMLLFSTRPRDIDGAIDAYRESIAIANTANSKQDEALGRLFLAAAMVVGRRTDAAMVLYDAITFADQARYTATLTNSVEMVSFYLVRNSRLEPAAVILGHFEHRPAVFQMIAEMRERSLAAIADLADLDSLKATGAAMNRPQIIDYALTQLDNQ